MLRKLTRRIIRDELKKTYNAGYDAGLAKGYELGYRMSKTERTNRGFIIGSKVDQQLEEILREKNG